MSESREHADLVRCIYSYVKSIVPESLHCLIELDTIDTKKPPCVGGYIPDVYYHWMGHLIIGEAKTINDFSRTHSYQQFAAYIT